MSCHSIPIYLVNANPIVMIVEDKSEIDLRHPRDKKNLTSNEQVEIYLWA